MLVTARQTDKQIDKQTNIIPCQKGGDKDKSTWYKRAVVLFKVFKKVTFLENIIMGEEERAF